MFKKSIIVLAMMLMAVPASFAYLSCDPACTDPVPPGGSVVFFPSDFFGCMFGACPAPFPQPGATVGECYVCPDYLLSGGYQCGPGYGYVGYGYGYACPSGDDNDPPVDADVEVSCDDNVVDVAGGGDDAHVVVRDDETNEIIAAGDTEDGQFTFPGCGMTVDVKVTQPGHDTYEEEMELVDCSECAPQVCEDDEQLVEGECVPIPCECGEIVNKQCVAFQCCADSDCGENEICEGHQCKPKPTGGCSSDLQCADNEYCDIPPGQNEGACKDVEPGACGEVKNHQFVPYGYECGTEPGCPSCPTGEQCVQHSCVSVDLSCPTQGVVGADQTCNSDFSELCQEGGCVVEVTAPDGKKVAADVQEDGTFDVPLPLEGTYKVALLKDGNVVKLVEVRALPQAQPGEPETPTGAQDSPLNYIWLLLLLLLIVLGVIYWRSRGQKK